MKQETVLVKVPMGHIEYTPQELEKEIADLQFFKDAFLVLLNPKVTEDSDIVYTLPEVLKYAKEMYSNSEYCNDFIDKCFNK